MTPHRTPRERSGMVLCPRDARGRMQPLDPLARFAEKCRFDPFTGCVVWTGGRTRGRGNTAQYGSFWYEGRRWFAHRWAAVHVHRLDVGALQVAHVCPHGSFSLCVEHVAAQTIADNVAEGNKRRSPAARAEQDAATRQRWLLVERGYEELPLPVAIERPDIPFFTPPEWLRPFTQQEPALCPF